MAVKKKARKTPKKRAKKKVSKKKMRSSAARPTCVWSANHLACTNTNGVLNAIGEIRARFSNAKDIPMPKLGFWSDLDSAEMRANKANALGGRIDRLFRFLLGAGYEQGVNMTKAIEAMQKTLVSAEKTVCDLAATVDANYRFRGES